jgi:hypothetical protein
MQQVKRLAFRDRSSELRATPLLLFREIAVSDRDTWHIIINLPPFPLLRLARLHLVDVPFVLPPRVRPLVTGEAGRVSTGEEDRGGGMHVPEVALSVSPLVATIEDLVTAFYFARQGREKERRVN